MPGRGKPRTAQTPEAKQNGTLKTRTVTSPSRCTLTGLKPTNTFEEQAERKGKKMPLENIDEDRQNTPGSSGGEGSPKMDRENIQTTTAQETTKFNSTASGAQPKTCDAQDKFKLENKEIKKAPKKTTRKKSAKASCTEDNSSDMNQENIQTTTAQETTKFNSTASGAQPKTCDAQDKLKLENKEIKKAPKKTTRKKSAKGSCTEDDSPDTNQENIQTTTAQETSQVNCAASDANSKKCRAAIKSPADEKEEVSSTILKGSEAGIEQAESSKKGVTQVRKQLSLDDGKKANTAKKEPSSTLKATLGKLKIRMNEKSKASEVINNIEKVILDHLRKKTISFRQVDEPLHTGSYYENLKISNPDEFDIMFPIPVQRIEIQPYTGDGAFYVVSLKRGYNPLQSFQQEGKPLPASEILQEFRREVIDSIKKIPGVDIDRKKRGCPAVTLSIEVESHVISLDIVLCLVVQTSWPPFTKDGLKIEGWLGRKVKRNYTYKPYYLVPKYEGKGTDESNGILAKDCWRISFSHVEKDILRNHGSVKTCCERDGAQCCRKDCVKLLKHLLSLLKEQDESFDKFCSYHVKTTFLHACCSRTKDSEWAAADLTQCFEQLLEDFQVHLERKQLNNFFIPTQNLLSSCSQKSCTSLAQRIKKEQEEGFPIFKC